MEWVYWWCGCSGGVIAVAGAGVGELRVVAVVGAWDRVWEEKHREGGAGAGWWGAGISRGGVTRRYGGALGRGWVCFRGFGGGVGVWVELMFGWVWELQWWFGSVEEGGRGRGGASGRWVGGMACTRCGVWGWAYGWASVGSVVVLGVLVVYERGLASRDGGEGAGVGLSERVGGRVGGGGGRYRGVGDCWVVLGMWEGGVGGGMSGGGMRRLGEKGRVEWCGRGRVVWVLAGWGWLVWVVYVRIGGKEGEWGRARNVDGVGGDVPGGLVVLLKLVVVVGGGEGKGGVVGEEWLGGGWGFVGKGGAGRGGLKFGGVGVKVRYGGGKVVCGMG
uniref:Uncharacterized protein n=1 Tax=Knipowitschia caucasica TaxID=637954 RepID=A0AAV2JP61_KNICA